MNLRHSMFRIIMEMTAAIAAAQAVVMFVLPCMMSELDGGRRAFVDASALVILAGPMIAWRLRAAHLRSQLVDPDAPDAMSRSAKRLTGINVAIVIGAGLLLTGFSVRRAIEVSQRDATQRFERLADRVGSEAQRLLDRPHFGLRGLRGLYVANESIERGQFRAYVAAREMPLEFPGTLGFGFLQRVERDELNAFEEAERNDEAPDFAVRSASNDGVMYVSKFIEPLKKHWTAWGADFAADPVRRAAIERAVSSGKAALSGRIQLLEPTDLQAAVLYLMPVYKNGAPQGTPAEREASILGLLYAPVVVEPMLAGVRAATEDLVSVAVYDGEGTTDHDLLLGGTQTREAAKDAEYRTEKSIQTCGRTWSLLVHSTPAFEATVDHSTPVLVGMGGVLFTGMLSVLVWGLGSSRLHAVRLAEAMTADLSGAKQRAEAALRETDALRRTLDQHSIVSVADARGRIVAVNEMFCTISGYAREELLGQDHRVVNSGAHPKAFWVDMWRTVAGGKVWRGEVCNRAKNGSLYWVDNVIAPFFGDDGKVERYISIRTDITERKRSGDVLAQFKGVLDQTLDCVFMFRAEDFRFVYVNEGARRQVGYSEAELLTMTPLDIKPTFSLASFRAMVDPMLKGEVASHIFETVHRHKDGHDVPVEISLQFVRATGEGEGRFVAVVRDITERQRAERALRDSERRMRTIIEAEPECVKIVGHGGELLEMNPAGLVMLEVASIEEARRHGLLNFVAPDSRIAFEELHERALAGEAGTLTFEIVGLTGTRRWMDANVVPMRNETGAVTAALAVSRDITAQRANEAALREGEQRWRCVMDSDMFGMLTWDEHGQIGDANEAFLKMVGYSTEDLRSGLWDWRRMTPPEHAAVDAEAMREVKIAGSCKPFEKEYWRKDGSRAAVMIGATSFQTSAGAGGIAFVLDMSERRAADDKLRTAEAFLRSAIDSLDAHTVVLGSDARIRSVNRAWLEFAAANGGQGCAVLEGADYLAECDRGSEVCPEAGTVATAIRAVLAGENDPSPIEYACHSPTERRWFLCSIRGFTSGRERFVAVSHLNITAVKESESQLRETNAALVMAQRAAESASRAKSEFLANMSHEIRTPLTAILGFTDLLRDDGNLEAAPESRKQTVETIKNAGQHLLTVINDILDLSKIEADKMTVERIDCGLLSVVREVESLLRPRATGKGVALRAALTGPVPERMMSDPTRLRQILMNLVGNAVKFTESGSVSLAIGTETLGGGDRIVIDISDTGTGMSDEQAGRLFSAFGQADGTVTRKFGGTGLGLTISRRLANLMGGDVKLLWSEPGKGSCFRLVLPLEPVQGTAFVTDLSVVRTQTQDGQSGGDVQLNGRILLAEDGVDNQRLIAFHLRKAGAQVDVAVNGRVALEMLDRADAAGTTYGMVLTDMQMPEIDGYTLARTLRERGSTLAIVALTAHAMAEDRIRCIAAGCDDYASKPIDKAALIGTCAAWLGKVSPMRAAAASE